MAAPHVVVRNSANNRQNHRRSQRAGLLSVDFSNSSSDDEFENDSELQKGEAYINLKSSKGRSSFLWTWKRNRKILNFCHQFCFFFVILSGFLVLVTLAWLHFALRGRTEDLNAQIRQGRKLIKLI